MRSVSAKAASLLAVAAMAVSACVLPARRRVHIDPSSLGRLDGLRAGRPVILRGVDGRDVRFAFDDSLTFLLRGVGKKTMSCRSAVVTGNVLDCRSPAGVLWQVDLTRVHNPFFVDNSGHFNAGGTVAIVVVVLGGLLVAFGSTEQQSH